MRTIIIWIFMTGLVLSADTVMYRTALNAYGASGDAILSASRSQLGCLSSAGEVAAFINDSDSTLYKITDYGNTISGVLSLSATAERGYHNNLISNADTGYMVLNTVDSLYVYTINFSGAAPVLIDSGGVNIANDDGCRYNLAFLKPDEDTIIATAYASAIGFEINGAISTDRGRTWSDIGGVIDIPSSASYRAGTVETPEGDSVISMLYHFRNEYTNVYVTSVKESGESIDTTYLGAQPTEGSSVKGFVRDFSLIVDYGGNIHYFISDTLTPSHIHHYWKSPDSTNFHHDTAWTSDKQEQNYNVSAVNGHSRGMGIFAEVIGADSSVCLFFTTSKDSTLDAEKVLRFMRWDEETAAWGTSIEVSETDDIADITGCYYVPASHGRVAYVMYESDDTYIASVGWGSIRKTVIIQVGGDY